MGYGYLQMYGFCLPHRHGYMKNLWVLRGYGFSEVWVRRGSTVLCDTVTGSPIAFECGQKGEASTCSLRRTYARALHTLSTSPRYYTCTCTSKCTRSSKCF